MGLQAILQAIAANANPQPAQGVTAAPIGGLPGMPAYRVATPHPLVNPTPGIAGGQPFDPFGAQVPDPGLMQTLLHGLASGGLPATDPNQPAQPQTQAAPSGQTPKSPLDLIMQGNAIPDAKRKAPAFRTADLAGLAAALLSGNQAPQAIAGYLQAKQGIAQDDTQRAQSDVERQRQGLYQQAQYQTQDEARKAQEAARQQEFDLKKKTLDDGNSFKAADDKRQAIQLWANAYDRAKSLPALQAAAAQLTANGVPGYDDPDTLAKDWQDRQRGNDLKDAAFKRQIVNDWSNDLAKEATTFGEIDPARAKVLMARRDALAKQHGIDPSEFQPIRTGETLKADAQKAQDERFTQTFGLNKAKWQSTLANQAANLDLARQRLDYTKTHGDAMLQTAEGRLALAQYNAAARGLKASVGDKNVGALKRIDQQIAGLKTQIDMTNDVKKRAALQGSIGKLQGQRDFVSSLLPEDLQQQDAMANVPGAIQGMTGGLAPQTSQVYDKRATISPVTQGGTTDLSRFDPASSAGRKFMGQTFRSGETDLLQQAQKAVQQYRNNPKALAAIQNEIVRQLQARRGK